MANFIRLGAEMTTGVVRRSRARNHQRQAFTSQELTSHPESRKGNMWSLAIIGYPSLFPLYMLDIPQSQ